MEGLTLILVGILFMIVGKAKKNDKNSKDEYLRGYQDGLNSHHAGNDGGDNNDDS